MPTYALVANTQDSEGNWRGIFDAHDRNYPWDTKIRKVVWRGALSEAEWRDALTSVRWRVAKLVHEMRSEQFDVGLTGIPQWLTAHIDFDLSQIGGFVDGITPATAFQKYRAILDMDGNSWSSRFSDLLCFNSVVVKVEPQFVEYFHAELKPWVHYIPVRYDLSDLNAQAAWALDGANDAAVRAIVAAANQWCSTRLLPDELARDVLDLWETYAGRLYRADPNWQEKWKQKREQISASASDFDLMQLH